MDCLVTLTSKTTSSLNNTKKKLITEMFEKTRQNGAEKNFGLQRLLYHLRQTQEKRTNDQSRNYTAKASSQSRSCYWDLNSNQIATDTDTGHWKAIWNTKSPPYVTCFSWLVCRKAGLTIEALQT